MDNLEYLCDIFGIPKEDLRDFVFKPKVSKTYRFTKGKLRGDVEVVNSKIVTIDIESIDGDFNLIFHNPNDDTSLQQFFKNINVIINR
jgi:hypothetical protein